MIQFLKGCIPKKARHIFDYEILANRLRDLAFLNPIKITLTDKRGEEEKKEVYYNTGGVSDFVKYLNENKKVLQDEPIHFTKDKKGSLLMLQSNIMIHIMN